MVSNETCSEGFYSFLRLVGCECFAKVKSSFTHMVSNKRADALFFKCLEDSNSDQLKHIFIG